jgi:circadian clock protein KaiC
VLTILTVAQAGMIGPMTSPVDVSYLADTVVVLRFYEVRGELHKAVSVLKRRIGRHAREIRELVMDERGVRVGERLSGLQGVFSGVPQILAGT